jgi:hypothetical protein
MKEIEGNSISAQSDLNEWLTKKLLKECHDFSKWVDLTWEII